MTHVMATKSFHGKARRAARCFSIGQVAQRSSGAIWPHRRPRCLVRRLRCAPLVVSPHHGATRAWPANKTTRSHGPLSSQVGITRLLGKP